MVFHHFSSFYQKKTEKVVVFRLNMAIFGALNRMFTLNLEVTSEWTGRSKRGHSVSGQYVTYLGVTSFVGHILIENPAFTLFTADFTRCMHARVH